MDLTEAIRAGDRLALARLLTRVENGEPQALAMADELYRLGGNAHIIGITGGPGTGKSTLVNQLAVEIAGRGEQVAVLAVDPSSPFSGGALLGDRIRMREAMQKPEVFIRSMASRGALGGLAQAAATAIEVLDGAGFPYVLVETVGAGQSEVDIVSLAHSVIVVEAPGLGDEIQALKAGILEIADILVVNKADLFEAQLTQQNLAGMLEMARPKPGGWKTELLLTQANRGVGVTELVDALLRHRQFLEERGLWGERGKARINRQFREQLSETWLREFQEHHAARYSAVVEQVLQRRLGLLEGVEQLLKER